MKPVVPELLLVFYMLLPVKHALIAQILLCQIQAVRTARQAEKKLELNLDNGTDTDETLRQFLLSFWLAPSNTTAYAYLALLAPHIDLFDRPIREIRRQVASNKLEFSQHAANECIMYQIQTHEIAEAIANGQLIEKSYIEDSSTKQHNSSYLIFGLTNADRPIHIKCSDRTRHFIKILAVYVPEPE